MIAPPATSSVFRQVRGLEVLTWPAFDAFGVDVLVTTRRGGISAGPYASLNLSFNVGDEPAAVLENRRRAAVALGARLDDVVVAEQVHGAVAAVVGAADRGRGARPDAAAVPGADALATADPGTTLAVLAADCVPVVLYDPVAHVLACAHAGWRGTVAGGGRGRGRGHAVARQPGPPMWSPGWGPRSPRTATRWAPRSRMRPARAFADRAPGVLRATGPGQWQFDLWAANRLVLQDAGVPAAQIHVADVPTGPPGPPPDGRARRRPDCPGTCLTPGAPPVPGIRRAPDGGWFFSHRSEKPCGRFAALARLRPAVPR